MTGRKPLPSRYGVGSFNSDAAIPRKWYENIPKRGDSHDHGIHYAKWKRRKSVVSPEEVLLQRLFSTFPGGWAGTCLLLLRAVFGSTVLIEGRFYLGQPDPSAATWSVGLLAIIAGGMLLVGFLTPVAGALVGLAAIGLALSLIPVPTPNLWDSQIAIIFGVTMLLAIIGLGPGAFSVDARVFGRREIIIPRADFPSE